MSIRRAEKGRCLGDGGVGGSGGWVVGTNSICFVFVLGGRKKPTRLGGGLVGGRHSELDSECKASMSVFC